MRAKKAKPLSDAMMRMLRDIKDHGDPTYSLNGMSAHGGATQTEWALRKRGLIADRGYALTPEGHTALTGETTTMQSSEPEKRS